MNIFRNQIALITIFVAILILSCSKEKSSPTEPPIKTIAPLTITPLQSAPGGKVSISGFRIDESNIENYSVYVGDELIPFRAGADSVVTIVTPLFYDTASSSWYTRPTGSQAVGIYLMDTLVAQTEVGLTILALPRATGTTQQILKSGESFTVAMIKLFELLPVVDSMEIPVREAAIASLTALLSEGDSSLAAILDGSSSLMDGITPDFELTDALLASSGISEYFIKLTGGFGSLIDSSFNSRSGNNSFLCRSGGADMDLACGMQVYEVARDWRIQVLNEVQEGFDNITGTITGLVGLSGKSIPHVALVSAVLYVMEMLYDRNLLALLPSQVTSFELAITSDTIEVDEYTSSIMVIRASNQPFTLTLENIINDALKLLPFASSGNEEFVTTFKQFLEGAAKFALNKYLDVLIASGSFGDIQLGQTPLIPYIAEVTNSDLVVLFSDDESIIVGDESALEWRGVSRGLGRVEGRSRGPGERSKVLIDNRLCLGCVYGGAAFGNSAPSTGLTSVPVGHKYDLELNITGLPDGVDGDVGLLWPDGNFTAHTATTTIKGLDPGSYSITALPVTGSDGTEYVPDPDNQTVTVAAGGENTATVDYSPKYGNLLLVVSGLPDGVDGEIDITGPDSYSKHVTVSGLIDTMLAGDYTITARDVTDPVDGKTLKPTPTTQTITIVGGQTATAEVDYQSGVVLRVFLGGNLDYLYNFFEGHVNMAWVTCGSPGGGSTRIADSLFTPDLSYGDGLNYCRLEGGNEMDDNESASFSASCAIVEATASSSLSIGYSASNKELTVEYTVSVVGDAPTPTDSTPFFTYNSSGYADVLSRIILEVVNDESRNLAFEITYNITASYSTVPQTTFELLAGSVLAITGDCSFGSAFWSSNSFFTESGQSFSGVDTLSFVNSPFQHPWISVRAHVRASGRTGTDGNGEAVEMYSSQVSSTGQIKFRLIELPQ